MAQTAAALAQTGAAAVQIGAAAAPVIYNMLPSAAAVNDYYGDVVNRVLGRRAVGSMLFDVRHHNLTLQCRSGRKTTSPPKTQRRSSRGGHPEGREGRPHGDQWTLSVKSEIHTPHFDQTPI